MAYIKSYSNYVLKRKHQDINSGTIYERDITTIGGLNQFAKGQVPIYKSSNFIITVNNENNANRNFINDGGWEKNGTGDTWTLSSINESNGVESTEKTLKIVLKQDYYKLRDFAYFGSCVELIRASIIDIVNRFPGELYVPSINGEGIPVYYEEIGNNEPQRLGGNNLVLVDNPHNINIHTEELGKYEIDNPLKYMCNNGYKNYTSSDLTDSGCTWSVTTNDECVNVGNTKQLLLSTININGFTIYAYKCNLGIFYLTNKSNVGKIITRPNKKNIEEFFNSLDNFQKILMNRNSQPEYSSVFEVMSENSFGYITELKTFTFPKTYGNYNLSVGDGSYESYVNSLQKYAEFYDEYFSDNIWRSMTHESIKNFDWTYTREYGVGEEEEYVFGGTRMQKTLRLIGREFDEIKTYIDALKNYQKVDYGKCNAIPDYFLTDAVNQEGWDVENIYPYNSDFKQVQILENVQITPYSVNHINQKHKNGYFYKCNNNCNGKPSLIEAKDDYANKSEIYDECIDGIRSKISQYSSEKEYSINDINNHFMRMLKLNSKNIFRKKGTIQSIETLLSLFGLKSKRWKDKYNDRLQSITNDSRALKSYNADYEIKEYVTATQGIEDIWLNNNTEMHKINWYNFTKTVTYDTDDYRQGVYYDYQGLPVRCYVKDGKYYRTDKLPMKNGEQIDINNGTYKRFLYPHFSSNKIIDGNPYYQMNGGWLKRTPNGFTYKNEIIDAEKVDLFKETYRNIRTVNNLKDLINIPKTSLNNGDICFVNDINGTYALVDGVIYDIFTDENDDKFIRTYVINNSAKLGDKIFASELTVSMPDGKFFRHVFSEYKENAEIRVYVIKTSGTMSAYGKYYGINNIQFFKNGMTVPSLNDKGDEKKEYTSFFKLNNVNNKTEINSYGWVQLSYKENDNNIDELKRINSIIDNFKGNNPHTGHMNYDNGKEYLSYFTKLFKYALEENQFNERCYPNDSFFSEIDNIEEIGFKGIFDENNDDKCFYNIYQDDKIHYLGNCLTEKTKVTKSDKFNKKITIDNTINNNFIRNKIEEMSLKDSHPTITNILDESNISDQIINIKRVDINFNINENNKDVIKFFDAVVMNYLEQILPSTLIINVNYCETIS